MSVPGVTAKSILGDITGSAVKPVQADVTTDIVQAQAVMDEVVDRVAKEFGAAVNAGLAAAMADLSKALAGLDGWTLTSDPVTIPSFSVRLTAPKGSTS